MAGMLNAVFGLTIFIGSEAKMSQQKQWQLDGNISMSEYVCESGCAEAKCNSVFTFSRLNILFNQMNWHAPSKSAGWTLSGFRNIRTSLSAF